MRIGISLAQCGRLARPAAVTAAARAAEQLGYSSVWVCDSVLDPAGVLAATASITSRVRLGAYVSLPSVSDPETLARALATVDVLSEGRLCVVLTGQDGRADRVLDALGSLDVPVLLDGTSPSSLDLVARRADGWGPTGLPVPAIAPLWAKVRDLAAAWGRDPDELQLVVRAGIVLHDRAVEGTRPSWHGDAEQVADDVERTRGMGADEVVFRLTGDLGLDEALDGYARIAEAAELRAVQMR
ncbi:MAG: LLM class flavin-dependent oxidoreductase [Actinomycetota bacterium]|nr:LLM class flavin-dependent oxidoreductase [Actinomycetota bacterium]